MPNLNINGFKPLVAKPLQPNGNNGQGVVPPVTPQVTPNYSGAAYQGGFPQPRAR